MTPSGSLTLFAISVNGGIPSGITSGPDGNLWFTLPAGTGSSGNTHYIGQITPSGAMTFFPVPTLDSFPSGIATGGDGNLWFTETGPSWIDGSRIGRITPAGSVTELPIPKTIGFDYRALPQEITAGPDGSLWFTDLVYKGLVG